MEYKYMYSRRYRYIPVTLPAVLSTQYSVRRIQLTVQVVYKYRYCIGNMAIQYTCIDNYSLKYALFQNREKGLQTVCRSAMQTFCTRVRENGIDAGQRHQQNTSPIPVLELY